MGLIPRMIDFFKKRRSEVGQFDVFSYLQIKKFSNGCDLKALHSDCQNKIVYCVGSGPSLDAVNIGGIRASTVILLNTSISIIHKVSDTNRIYWMATDVYRFWDIVDKVPDHVPKILIPHLYKSMRNIKNVWRKQDILLAPRACFRQGRPSDRISFQIPSIKPCYITRRQRTVQPQIKNGVPFRLLPCTVMLNALSLGASLEAKKVVALGFDVTGKKEGVSAPYAASAVPQKPAGSFNQDMIFEYLRRLKKDCDEKDISIQNWSPLTEENILEKYYLM